MKEFGNEHCYDDIIDLPHHVSKSHPKMSLYDRAAQFSPFAALTGYDDAIKETSRLTDKKQELDENFVDILDHKIQIIQERIAEKPEVTITFFKPDNKKAGGSYETVVGNVKKIDGYERAIVMQDGNVVMINQIVDMEGSIFNNILYE